MRIDIHAINTMIGPELRQYAQTRMWRAARRWSRNVAWVGLWLVNHQDEQDAALLACRLDAWVSEVGVVSVQHADSDPHVAIDIAAAMLEQAIERRMTQLKHQRVRASALATAGARSRRPARPGVFRGIRRMAHLGSTHDQPQTDEDDDMSYQDDDLQEVEVE